MGSPSSHPSPHRIGALLIAAGIAVLAFLPIANWIPGGHQASWYALVASGWVSGTVIVVGCGVVLGILSGKIGALWHEGAGSGLAGRWADRPILYGLVVSVVAFTVYCAVALHVFSGRPLSIDGLVQVLHAQILASGHLWRPTFADPAFFSSLHVIDM